MTEQFMTEHTTPDRDHRRGWLVALVDKVRNGLGTTKVFDGETEQAPAQENWVRTYENGLDFVESRGGVDWAAAPKPHPVHRCQPQTRGFFAGRSFGMTERCACGAARLDRNGPWIERNSR